MALDHASKLLVGLEPLPLEGVAPVVEEAAGPALPLVVPELAERLLEDVGGVEPAVGGQEQLQRLTPFVAEVGGRREQRVLLAFDEAVVVAGDAGIFALADLVQGLAQVTEHVELVVEDASLRRVARLERGRAECLPHVHDREADFPALFGAEPGIELVQALLGAVRAAEPDWPAADQVADHDPVGVALADADLVDADDRGGGVAGAAQLLVHVLFVQVLDGLPVQAQLAGHIPEGRCPTAPPDEEGEAFGVEGVVGQPAELLLLHGAAPPAVDAPDFDLQEDPGVPAGEVADAPDLAVVEAARPLPADAAGRFFRRRRRRSTRTLGSPKTPRTTFSGSKPGKRYASSRRRRCSIRGSWQVFPRRETANRPEKQPRKGNHG